jgi:hypothetical protein
VFSVRNLRYMKKFAELISYEDKLQTVSAVLTWSHNKYLFDKSKSLDEYTWYAGQLNFYLDDILLGPDFMRPLHEEGVKQQRACSAVCERTTNASAATLQTAQFSSHKGASLTHAPLTGRLP